MNEQVHGRSINTSSLQASTSSTSLVKVQEETYTQRYTVGRVICFYWYHIAT